MRLASHFRLRALEAPVAYRNRRVAHTGSLDDFTHPAAARLGAAAPVTRPCERRHEHAAMGQIPAELGQTARFTPDRPESSSPYSTLSPIKSAAYASWHVWRGICMSSLWNGDRIWP
jgi:hypothetical protein